MRCQPRITDDHESGYRRDVRSQSEVLWCDVLHSVQEASAAVGVRLGRWQPGADHGSCGLVVQNDSDIAEGVVVQAGVNRLPPWQANDVCISERVGTPSKRNGDQRQKDAVT